MKQRIYSQLETASKKRLAAFAARAGTSEAQVIVTAVEMFLSPDAQDKRDAGVTRRLNRLLRQFELMSRDQMILSETLALFIQYQLAVIPPVPITDQAAARAKAHENMEKFMAQLVRRLESGRHLIGNIFERVQSAEEDFFSLDLDEPEGQDSDG